MMRTQSQRTMPAARFSTTSQKSSLASCSGRPSPCALRCVGRPHGSRLRKLHSSSHLLGCCWVELIPKEANPSRRYLHFNRKGKAQLDSYRLSHSMEKFHCLWEEVLVENFLMSSKNNFV